jgi:glucokinase
MQRDIIAGIDIGGTKIAVAFASTAGEMFFKTRFPTQTERGARNIWNDTLARIGRLAEEANARIIAIGIGCGGPLNRARGVILSPPNLPGWDEFPIVELTRAKFDVPIVLDNDANAAALGELRYGAGRGLQNLVYITISTGIGGGVIVNEKVVHGVGDGGGEIGHLTILPDGVECKCGARGCLEMLASGTNVARRARERLQTGAPSLMLEMAGGIERVTAQTVSDAARAGDAIAREIWDETVRYIAIGVNDIIVTLAPQAVILGGGVMATGEQLLEPLRAEVKRRVKILPVKEVQILPAALGGDSGIYGALILGQDAHQASKKANV